MIGRILFCLVLVSWVGLGCSFRMGDLNIVSSKNVALNPEPIRHGVEGRDCAYRFLFFIPLGSWIPNTEEAMDRAMEKVPQANLMTNIAIYRQKVFTLLVNMDCFEVKGDLGELR
jgi:hypothetical protein